MQHCAELNGPLSTGGEHTLMRRIRPNIAIGPVEELSVFDVGTDSGTDVKSKNKNAWANADQSCRLVADRDKEM